MSDIVSIAGVVVRDADGRYLLVQEGRKDVYGLWALPAGHIDEGETPATAALREGKEETGYEMELLRAEVYWQATEIKADYVFYTFLARVTGGNQRDPNDEILDVAWLSFDDVKALDQQGKIRSSWSFESIKKVENDENPWD